jgi:hypothetical protein
LFTIITGRPDVFKGNLARYAKIDVGKIHTFWYQISWNWKSRIPCCIMKHIFSHFVCSKRKTADSTNINWKNTTLQNSHKSLEICVREEYSTVIENYMFSMRVGSSSINWLNWSSKIFKYYVCSHSEKSLPIALVDSLVGSHVLLKL